MTFKKGQNLDLKRMLETALILKKKQLEKEKEATEAKLKGSLQLLERYVEQAKKAKSNGN